MLLTVTMNPSVDISYRLETLNIDGVNRTSDVSKTAGGKGLNVARVAKQTGLDVAATGLLGGHLGRFIHDQLEAINIQDNFYLINQETRNCIAIIHEGNQTEVLESGPSISAKEQEEFLNHFKQLVISGKFKLITISGSLPSGMSSDVYRQMIQMANEVNIPVVLDTSGQSLIDVLNDDTLSLFAIKPNLDELQAIEKEAAVTDQADIMRLLQGTRYQKCEWIILSMGSQGALVKHQDNFYQVTVPKIEAVNPVGSGDSSVAGFAYGYLTRSEPENMMIASMTTGVLNTLNEKTGHIDFERFQEIADQITVTSIN